jgi:NAD(P)-dependent dehydrogenase (short-subunit alcohol dehydrogenase family)
MGRLDNKVTLITGATSGIGRASARLFAQEGAKMVTVGRDSNRGQETVRLIRKTGGEVIFVKADVTKMADLDRIVKATVDIYGKLNILFSNVGRFGPRGREEVNEDEWVTYMDVNAKAHFLLPNLLFLKCERLEVVLYCSPLVKSSRCE